MTTEATNNPNASGSPLDGAVRPFAWLTNESKRRLAAGGNGSRGTVPAHPERSVVADYPLYCGDSLIAAVAAERERRVHLAGELQALRNHVEHWSRAGIDAAALMRADAALREWA